MAVVQVPGIGIDCRLVLLLAEGVVVLGDVQAAEDEPRLNIEALEGGQVGLDVQLQRERQAAERGHERLLGGEVVEDALAEVVGGFDAHAAAAELLEAARIAERVGPSCEADGLRHGRAVQWVGECCAADGRGANRCQRLDAACDGCVRVSASPDVRQGVGGRGWDGD